MYQRAIVRQFGEAAEVVELEPYVPQPLAADSVRLRMIARSINPSDLISISGAYRARTALPFVPGFEGIGVVEELGHAVGPFARGTRVIPIGSAGTWADTKDCPAAWCLAVPDGVSDEQAAAGYVNPMTAWAMLHEVAHVEPGMRIAVTAAGSAIGQMIIRLANEIGLVPIAFVRSARAAENVGRLSAEIVRYDERLDQYAFASNRIDVIFDCVGGAGAISLAQSLRKGGMFVHYGLLSGQPIPPQFWSDRPDIRFSMFHLRNWIREVPLQQVHRTYARVASAIADGLIRTTVRRCYRLPDIKAALADARHASAEGKVLITN